MSGVYVDGKFYDLGNLEIKNLDNADRIVAASKAIANELVRRGVKTHKISYGFDAPKHYMWDDVTTLADLPDEDDFPVYKSGFGFLDKNLGWGWRIPELNVIAGPYGSGKSTFGQILAAGFVAGAGRELRSGALLCSWEDIASEVKRNFRLYGEAHGVADMWDRISFVRRPAAMDRLVSWFMELVEYHFRRYGTRFFYLDPWNEMDHRKDTRLSETDYVRDVMKDFRRLVDRLGIILNIATHVSAKVIRGDGTIEPFRIAHAFGSVQFANKADRGMCVLRSKRIQAPLNMNGKPSGEPIQYENGFLIARLDKSKIERKMGRRGVVACRFDPNRFCYEYDANATKYVQDIWRD